MFVLAKTYAETLHLLGIFLHKLPVLVVMSMLSSSYAAGSSPVLQQFHSLRLSLIGLLGIWPVTHICSAEKEAGLLRVNPRRDFWRSTDELCSIGRTSERRLKLLY